MPVTTLRERKRDLFYFLKQKGGATVPIQDVVAFLKQFSTMLGTGVPIIKTMSVLVSQTSNNRLKNALISVRYDVVECGMRFHSAFKKFPSIFSPFFLGMLQVGEETGSLAEILNKLLYWYEKELRLRTKLTSILVYPALVTLTCFACLILVMKFVLPKIIPFLSGIREQKLPIPTQIVVFIEEKFFINNLYLLILFLIVGGAIALRYGLKRSRSLRNWVFKHVISRLPAFGKLYHRLFLSRFCKSMHFLLAAGIRMEPALRISANMLEDSVYKEKVNEVVLKIRQGESLGDSFKDVRVFPPMLESCVALGEEIGGLPSFLIQINDLYEMEIDIILERIVALLEPMVILFLGFFAGFIVISIFLPIYQIR